MTSGDMTNYNERLDKVLQNLSWKQHELGTKGLIPLSRHEYEAKQALTSLIKELVAEAKPPTFEPEINSEGDKYLTDTKDGYNRGVTDYEANLLKVLEEI